MRHAAMASLARVGVPRRDQGVRVFRARHSVAVLASFADSALDLFTSTLNIVAIRSALTPADAEHRFGHGKAEPLAGLAQGAFIAGIGDVSCHSGDQPAHRARAGGAAAPSRLA